MLLVTLLLVMVSQRFMHFNTSNVSDRRLYDKTIFSAFNNFNTSNVSDRPLDISAENSTSPGFNTSNVSDRHQSYHNQKRRCNSFNTSNVPDRPIRSAALFLYICSFQYIKCSGSTVLLFYLNNNLNIFQYIKCFGSTGSALGGSRRLRRFQYIKCFGSTTTYGAQTTPPPDFNTSNVSDRPVPPS